MHSVLDALPLGIIYLDLDYTIQLVNGAFTPMIGLDPSGLIGRSIFDITDHVHMRKFGQTAIVKALKSKTILRNHEIGVHHCTSGESKILLVSVLPLGGGRPALSGYVIFAEDITQRKYWYVYKFQDSREDLIAEFAATTAHEIRNPLTTLRGFLQLQSKRSTPQGSRDYWQIMIEAVDHIDLLMTERLAAHGPSLMPGWNTMPFATAFKGLERIIAAQTDLAGITLDIGMLPDVYIYTNIGEYRRLVLHLVENSLDAMTNGGVLSIRNELNGPWLHTLIMDTGEGVAPEHLPYIFDPFFSTKPAHGGMGLTLSRYIAHAHGGEIDILPRGNGKGCTVIVRLPHQGDML